MEEREQREPTPKEICLMCHLSSVCQGCCKTCTYLCNGSQICQQGMDKQMDRLESWCCFVEDQIKEGKKVIFREPEENREGAKI